MRLLRYDGVTVSRVSFVLRYCAEVRATPPTSPKALRYVPGTFKCSTFKLPASQAESPAITAYAERLSLILRVVGKRRCVSTGRSMPGACAPDSTAQKCRGLAI